MTEQIIQVKNIHQRLHAVMESVKYVQKEDKKVNGQYRFVSHDAVSALIRPELVKHGILLVTSIKSHIQEGNRTEVDIELSFCNIDVPEDKIIILAFGYGIDNQDKGPGKAISYAVKYALLKMFCLETGDDPENDNIEYKKTKNSYSGEEYDHLMTFIINGIADINNAEDANSFKDLMKRTKHIHDSKVRAWNMLKGRANELELEYNEKENKFYEIT